MAQSRMNISARTFDLCSSLINAAQPTNALVLSTQQLLKWLARERIDESIFIKCTNVARGLAYPNENGLAIRSSIEEADKRLQGLKGAPLSLVLSGSLGRLMAQDVDFCYMVSTVTSLAAFYGNDRITQVLLSMMMDACDPNDHSNGVNFRYQVQREPIRAVTSKIVESIFINVVNAGHKMGALPEELRHLHVHIVRHETFAAIVMGIGRASGDILLVSERFIGDIATWLFYHFDGRLEISVGNKILYAKKLGSNAQVVCMVVQHTCSDTDRDTETCFQHESSIKVSEAMGDGKYTTFLKGSHDADLPSSRPRSHTRRALYCEDSTLESTYRPLRATNLNRAERNHVVAVAKQIMSWLLNIPIEPVPTSFTELRFKARLDNCVDTSLRVRDILCAHPGRLLQENTGSLPSTAPVFKGIPEDLTLRSADYGLSDLAPTTILSCFPITMDLMDSVQSRCICSVCADRGPLEDVKLGCLRNLAYVELFVLLAHAISDSLGAKDVSGLSQSKDIVGAVRTLFSKLLQKGLVVWDDWFTVAACTAAGAPMQTFTSNRTMAGESSPVAIQNGCFVAVAPWVSLQRELILRGCFGLEFFEGNLRGISEDLALLRCEMRVESSNIATEAESLGSHEIQDEDHTEAEINTAIFRVDTSLYRLMTLVKATTCLRIVDPSQVLHGLSNAIFTKCPHTIDETAHDNNAIQGELRVYRFDEILADWDNSSGVNDVIQTTQVFADHLKFNVAVSLTISGLVVRDVASSCLSCAVRDVRGASRKKTLCLVQRRLPLSFHRLRIE